MVGADGDHLARPHEQWCVGDVVQPETLTGVRTGPLPPVVAGRDQRPAVRVRQQYAVLLLQPYGGRTVLSQSYGAEHHP
ncbi:hypothetical protein OOK27_07335 [Streptomyces canus]|uniref:hypothetical protein n=1 Tax=Streptomyces canus TaxID=58343 RepID=UPI00225B7197|nr:hypothetical protein [Streptomyces canus]MCX5253985.1 hypothetical protein [Streptomyces canus]